MILTLPAWDWVIPPGLEEAQDDRVEIRAYLDEHADLTEN